MTKSSVSIVYGSYHDISDNSQIMRMIVDYISELENIDVDAIINSFSFVANNPFDVANHSTFLLKEIKEIKDSDGVIVVVPIAYNTMHGAMKLFFDSLIFNYLKDKPVLIVANSGSIRSHSSSQENTFSIFNSMHAKPFNEFSYFSKDYEETLFYPRLTNNIFNFVESLQNK